MNEVCSPTRGELPTNPGIDMFTKLAAVLRVMSKTYSRG